MKAAPPRRYRIPASQLSWFGARARSLARASQREIAGLLVARDDLLQLVELRNVSKRRGSFEIRRSDIRKADRAARVVSSTVVGTFHSHLVSEAKPGPRDIREASDGTLVLICDTIGQEWRLWRIRTGRAYKIAFALL